MVLAPSALADLIIGGPGNIVLAEEGGTFDAGNLAPTGTPFALDVIAGGSFAAHQTVHLNDATYGNSNSWIGASADSFCGVSLGVTPMTVASIAFGRDNLGTFGDRNQGLYTLQYTQVADPNVSTLDTGDPSTGWAEIGTLDYGAPAPATLYQIPALRHRYNFDAIEATGVRIITAVNGTCIDEIELYGTPGMVQEPPPVVDLSPAPGFDITYDGNDGDFFDATPPPGGTHAPDNLARAGTAFGSSEFGGGGVHLIANVNDGFYGNSNSWISNFSAGDPNPTIGIDLGGSFEIDAIAWGRDNGNSAEGGQFTDRSVGVYSLQITTDPDPATTLDWSTIGTIGYTLAIDTTVGGGFTPWFRHQFGITTDLGGPVTATGVRLLVPNNGICIDELEVYAADAPPPPLNPVEEGGALDVGNLAASATAIAKDALGGRAVASLNDETYGDASAWAGATPDSFAGLSFGDLPITVRSIAFGRDNTGAMTDLALGDYTLQVTDVANPDENTPDSDWDSIWIISYMAGSPANPHLRHRFNIGMREVTGIRLLTPDGAAIDELEAYAEAFVPPPPPALIITPAAGFTASWDGNDGDFFDPTSPMVGGAQAPDNLALASNGATPFASSLLGDGAFAPAHTIPNLNDGTYGNSNSWIGADGDALPFVGISLPGPTALMGVAWGRDNGNGATDDSVAGTDACGGQCDDRSFGNYTLQFTTVANPDATTPNEAWTSIADFNYTPGVNSTDDMTGGLFTEWLRHQYAIGADGGGAIVATGIRILVPLSGLPVGTCIDEIELYGVAQPLEGPQMIVDYDAVSGDLTISWESAGGRLYNLRSETDPSAGDPADWPIFGGNENLAATPPMNSVTFPLPADATRLFVVEEFPAPPVEILADDFESGQGGWTFGSDGLAGTQWELGAPGAPGPLAANSPDNCFGTNLTSEYGFDANVWLRSPAIDLTTAAGATLCYHEFRDIESPGAEVFDFGTVSVLDAADDSVLAVVQTDITGVTVDWEKVTRALPAEALGKMVKIEFRLQSDDVGNFAGWYIDDFLVTVP